MKHPDIVLEAEKIVQKVLDDEGAAEISMKFKIPMQFKELFGEMILSLNDVIAEWWVAYDDGLSFGDFVLEHKKKSRE